AQEPPGRDMQKEAAIWEQLKIVAPTELETFKAATVAMGKGDYAHGVKLYEVVMLKAPDFDPVIRRLGISTVLAGKYEEGIGLLEHAVSKNRSPENLISLAQYLAYPTPNTAGSRDQKHRAFQLMTEAIKKP